MSPPISLITLLTDFGDRDYFVASMKGVILNINPQARIVDLSHHVAPYQIEDAAYVLKSSYRYFPDGAVHVAVVDPGVGSARRPLLVSTSRYFFLAPDNGLLTDIIQDELSVEVRQIENMQYRLDSEGTTFDGRDLFAPAAAWLTRGQAPGSFGRLIRDVATLPAQEPAWEGPTFVGRIVYVDHFGNLISNITPSHLAEIRRYTKRTSVLIRIAGKTIDDLTACYADGFSDAPRALINSNGHVEVFVKEGSAAHMLNVGRGQRMEIT
ncbi:MAG: SAM-dependent chlorinase/fluorinase [Nitrospirales bacterium]|nr:SAM-dependent chlorinase/fluorinase [Nitrospirales bacterium]